MPHSVPWLPRSPKKSNWLDQLPAVRDFLSLYTSFMQLGFDSLEDCLTLSCNTSADTPVLLENKFSSMSVSPVYSSIHLPGMLVLFSKRFCICIQNWASIFLHLRKLYMMEEYDRVKINDRKMHDSKALHN